LTELLYFKASFFREVSRNRCLHSLSGSEAHRFLTGITFLNIDEEKLGTGLGQEESDRSPSQSAKKKVLVAANPHSGAVDRRPLLEELCRALEAAGFETDLCYQLDSWQSKAAELLSEGTLAAVISAGGDGTLAAVVNRVDRGVPILVFPLGTENLLSKHYGLTADIDLAVKVLLRGNWIGIDAGEVNGRLFLVMLSCGFDAAVVGRMHSERRGHISHWTWAKPIWDTVRSYRYPAIQVRSADWREIGPENRSLGPSSEVRRNSDDALSKIDSSDDQRESTGENGGTVEFSAGWVFVFNVPRYAAGLPIADDAVDNDGLLDICTFQGGSTCRGLSYLWAILRRSHRRLRDCRVGRCKSIVLDSLDEVPYQVDGDYGGVLPIEVRVIPQRVRLLVP
jgi:diacylglycerol kinase (ATP)